MEKILAYKCGFCNKVHANRDTSQHHERICYRNPVTRSCATCAFLNLFSYKFEKGGYSEFQGCLKNQDISGKLKTRCEQYHQSEINEVSGEKVNIPAYAFDRELALERLADRIDSIKQQHEIHMAENQAAENELKHSANGYEQDRPEKTIMQRVPENKQTGKAEGVNMDSTNDKGIRLALAHDMIKKAKIRLNDDEHMEAIEACNGALKMDQNCIEAYIYRGIALMHSGELTKALANFNKAAEINPKNTNIYHHRGLAYGLMQDFDASAKDFETYIEAHPNDPEALINRGLCYTRMGFYTLAEQDFRAAIIKKPDSATAYYFRSLLRAEVGDLDKAAQDYQSAISLDPNLAGTVVPMNHNERYRLIEIISKIKQWRKSHN